MAPTHSWSPAPANLSLPDEAVHLWTINLQRLQEAENDERWSPLLSDEERDRAGRFRASSDRAGFLVRRAALRLILARYTGEQPQHLRFAEGPAGKPVLIDPSGTAGGGLHFNASHSDALALVAVTRAGPIGVDVERVRPMAELEQVAAAFFTARECSGLMALAPARRQAAFFRLWTRKEAVLKATGEGIAELLPRIELSLDQRPAQAILSFDGDAAEGARWQLEDIRPERGYAGAVATRGRGLRLHSFHF